MRRGHVDIRAGAVVLLAVLAAACSAATSDTTEPPPEGVVLRVVVNGDVVADWTLEELGDAVSFTELTIDGDLQNGPLLMDVLRASGVEEWESGRVVGFGEGRVFEVALDISASEVDSGWILDVNNRGRLKLASVELPRAQWVRDVGEVSVGG